MNSVSKVIGVIFAPVITVFCFNVWANPNSKQCSELRLVHNAAQQTVYRVVSIDSKQVNNKFKLSARENRIILPDGEHSFHIVEEPKMLYKKTNRDFKDSMWGGPSYISTDNASLFGQIKHHYVAANIEPNKAYVFNRTSDKKNLKLKKVMDKACEPSQMIALADKKYTSKSVEELTELQRSKLYKLSKLLGRIKKQGKSKSLFLPLSALAYFGVVVDEEYVDGAFKVLSVQPMSSAFELGLRSGDEIVRFNKRSSKKLEFKPVELLERFVNLLHYYDDIHLVINRDGKRKIIEGKYQPILIPEVWIKYEGENVAFSHDSWDLDWNEQLFYIEFLQELIESENKKLSKSDRLVIQSTARTVDKLGLKGKLTEQGRMELSFIDPYSVFAKLGMQIGDEIISYGKSKLGATNVPAFSKYFKKLSPNQIFYLEVKTELGIETLSGVFQPIVYPEIELVLDLKSIRNAKQNILLAYEGVKKSRKQSRKGFSQWAPQKKNRDKKPYDPDYLLYRKSTDPRYKN